MFSENADIAFKNQNDLAGVHIEGAHMINGQWKVTGVDGCVLIIVGHGTSMKAAQKQVYERVKNISIPNMYYRNDIGNSWAGDIKKLREWGYLNDD
jgi:phosphoribosylamine--glycine ligase